MTNLLATLACALALCSTACLDAEDADITPEDGAALPDDAVVYDTVATVAPDGTVVMSPPRPITVAEQRAQNLQRLHGPAIAASGYSVIGGAAAQDYACLADSLWLYARTDYTGDRICFSGSGTLHMADYSRFAMIGGHPYYLSWQIASGSFIAGARPGVLYGGGSSGSRSFDPYYAFYGTFQFPNLLTYIWLS